MGTVTILCSPTGRQVSTGMHTSAASFAALPQRQFTMHCWACGGEHLWSRRWATFVAAEIRAGQVVELADA